MPGSQRIICGKAIHMLIGIPHFNLRWGILTIIALITNIISIAPGWQAPARSSAVVLDMRAVHHSPQNPRLSALVKLSTRKEDDTSPYLFHLAACVPSGVLSRVIGIT